MAEKLKTYRELEVWQKAMDLVEVIYTLTKGLPKTEQFGLTSQMQRAAVSIPANVAEGYGRSHRGDYLRHLSFAKGSLAELETLLTLAVRLNLLTRQETLEAWNQAQAVGKMLTRLNQSLQPKSPNPDPRDPKPEPQIPKPEPPKAKPESRNPNPEPRDPKP